MIPIFKMFSYCLPSPENITIWGEFSGVVHQSVTIRLVRCRDRETCKNDTEIDEFIDNNGQVVYISNQQKYQREVYSGEVIEKRSKG